MAPPGWFTLKNGAFGNVTHQVSPPIKHRCPQSFRGMRLTVIQEIVSSSYRNYLKNGNNHIIPHKSLAENPVGILDQTERSSWYPATLPVLWNPHGEAISSINYNDKKRWPCMAGDFKWSDGPPPEIRGKYGSEDVQGRYREIELFIQATRLQYSMNFYNGCDANRDNDCTGSDSDGPDYDFQFVNQQGELMKKDWPDCNAPAWKKCNNQPADHFDNDGFWGWACLDHNKHEC